VIRRLHVRGYKSLVDATIELAPITVIFGPNGAGKSNFLDLIGLLSRLASAETVRQAFEGHRGRPLEAFHSAEGFGPQAYERLLQGPNRSFLVECDLELHPRIVDEVNDALTKREQLVGAEVPYTRVSETRLRYGLQITMHPQSGELFVTDERLQALKADFEPKKETSRRPFFELEDGDEGKPRFVARIERQSHPRYFESHRSRTLLSELSDPLYHPHVVAAAREIASWRVYYVEPGQLKRDVPVQAAEEPGRSGELLAAFYYTLQEKEPGTLRAIEQNLREIVPGFEGLRVGVRDGLLEMVARQKGGGEFPARLLSEGTLRLMSLIGLAAAPRPPAVVVYEEPENGVHAARLELLAEIIRTAVEVRPHGSQLVLTTHSPLVCNLLPDHLVVAGWSQDSGSLFEVFTLDRDSLFFESELARVLDAATAGRIATSTDPAA
jgi:predicted ATPase